MKTDIFISNSFTNENKIASKQSYFAKWIILSLFLITHHIQRFKPLNWECILVKQFLIFTVDNATISAKSYKDGYSKGQHDQFPTQTATSHSAIPHLRSPKQERDKGLVSENDTQQRSCVLLNIQKCIHTNASFSPRAYPFVFLDT